MFAPVYFDHNATTPVAPEVLAAMLPWFNTQYGNPSSRHDYGRAARAAVEQARQQVAAAVGAHPTEVIFVSGGSEANNLFLKGAAATCRPGLVAVGATEHPCVLQPAQQLHRQGWQLAQFAVNAHGELNPDSVAEIAQQRPRLASVMLANNETGVIQDLSTLAQSLKPAGTWLHTDAVQALGKIPLNFRELNRAGVHGMSISAHKAYGPKGIAALILDKRVEVQPLVAGGGHERGLRSGTENVPAIVGFGLAAERAAALAQTLPQHLGILRNQLEHGLHALGAQIFGAQAKSRLCNTTYFAFPHLDGETLVGKLDRAGFAVASGAACSSANPESSHVLHAMGVSSTWAQGAVRVSLGMSNTATEVENFLQVLQQTVKQLQHLTAVAV